MQRLREPHNKLAAELARIDETNAIKYHTRLLELAWDRRSFTEILAQGRALLTASESLGAGKSYEAMRFIAMAYFDNLANQAYNSADLPAVFPETMDELLGALNAEKPDDTDIARRYAEFLVNVGRADRLNFTASASETLCAKNRDERFTAAQNCMDDMVRRNANAGPVAAAAAHLARYHFIVQFSPSSVALDLAWPDLQQVLVLSPSSPEGLVLSGLHAFQQAGVAYTNGEEERALTWRKQGEDYLRRSIKDNPGNPIAYQYLGEYLLQIQRNPKEAISVWGAGVDQAASRGGNEELMGRLIMTLLQEKMVDEARERLNQLDGLIAQMRIRAPGNVYRTDQMRSLLNARLYNAEADFAQSRVEAAQQADNRNEVRRLFGVIQQKKGDALREYEKVLIDFGKTNEDYVVARQSVYYRLLPESLLQLAYLKMDWNEYDAAASYFSRALHFAEYARPAIIGMSIAYQQNNRLDMATRALATAAERWPDELAIRYMYAMALFRSQMSSNVADAAALEALQKELEALRERRSELPQPWIIDVRLIHLGVARAHLSNNAETIVRAMDEAVRKFRLLERESFPPDEEGNARNYIDDLAFAAELAGIYSSLSARADFDRLLERLRTFPDGEDMYYDARIGDARRRDSRSEAIDLIEEASQSELVSPAGKERFAALLENLKGGGLDAVAQIDRVYNQFKTTFDENPESLKPEAFFQLALIALEKGEKEYAQQVRDRLEKLEGPSGSRWRYIAVRQILSGEDPDFAEMRRLQEEILRYRSDWDRAYLLSAMIEERYLETNPGDTATREKVIIAYKNAIARGNLLPDVWLRLSEQLGSVGRDEEAQEVLRTAVLKGVTLDSQLGQLPQPYNKMYSDVREAIENEDATGADTIARQCIRLAEIRGANPELVFTLHFTLGKVFLDAELYPSAFRHLSEVAERGGMYIYPLALCVAKSGDVDGGFSLVLDEIDRVPSAMPVLLSRLLIMQAHVKPSEAVYERIDRLMDRLERGERLPTRGRIEPSDADEDNVIPLGTRWVEARRIQSLMIRFPEKTENLDPTAIQFIAPEKKAEEAPAGGE